LLTPTVAITGAVIAALQWIANRRKLKSALFDYRFAIYPAAQAHGEMKGDRRWG
jgi:hypothetical protein